MSRAFVSTCVLSLVCALGGVAAAQDAEAPAVEVAASAEVEPSPAPDAASAAASADVGDEAGEEGTSSGSDALSAQLRARQEIASIHRAFGVATWASMAITAVLGWIQFADEYGFHGSETETACYNNSAVFQELCSGVPWAHAIAGFTTAALYFTTAGLSLAMPAPLEPSADVELHKTLRWVHLATMLATAAFGVVTANIETDFQTRQALALVHQGLAVTTFGLLTAAAAVIIF